MADHAAGLPIAREGLPFVLAGAVPSLLAWFVGAHGLALGFGMLTGFTGWFFRNPARTSPPGEDIVVSPADGKVIAIHEEFEPRFLKDQAIRVSIFLNIFDVHINRMPCAGTIISTVYQPGRFLPANQPEATVHNEQNAVMIETLSQHKVLCVQVAGLVARRIVCWLSQGEHVLKGERFGLIRFGSRVDIFLPMGSVIAVEIGNRVKGGETILGTLSG